MIILINPEKRHSAARRVPCWFLRLDGFEQFLSILRLPRELFLLTAGCLGFLHAAKFLGGVFQPQVGVSVQFSVCYFAPESTLNQLAVDNYQKNICQCIRQWHYSETNNNTVDMMLAINLHHERAPGFLSAAVQTEADRTGERLPQPQWQGGDALQL